MILINCLLLRNHQMQKTVSCRNNMACRKHTTIIKYNYSHLFPLLPRKSIFFHIDAVSVMNLPLGDFNKFTDFDFLKMDYSLAFLILSMLP